ncbi:DNA mismatch repair MutL family protein [Chlamydia ibidis]|uniref:DNA mismatch repair protein MutL n=2 Tax=Chlamydia ibidis TaxID=1405396 RepID=S7J2L5_9CHLA|nr:DNA mismatch repair endonuclease MutL [Chlamydia ibidis]EPP34478.1 DNA mismatch repair MutL family protein [Chlamydia ibidis]EQM62283.1 DNA mismatch repair MutL family protein [Chlamydia ibidis 10-1398/6]
MSIRRPIRLLDSVTINQIAAGEVIESAVSVVKELVENSLDAGATEIEIETLGGGQGLIVVKDNGCGMTFEDIMLALQRHATSKIGEFADVFSLNSFGFRGEALPAIASICKMEVLSSTAIGQGIRCVVHGGDLLETKPSPRQQGTTIAIDSLFYNVPVRKGFQKSSHVDRLGIRRLLENCILACENVAWSWLSERQQEFSISKHQSLCERIAFVMGESFMKEALPLSYENGDIRIVGYLGNPNFHRPTRQGQRIFINDRPVESMWISKKITESYGLLLPSQRHPVFIVKLYLPSHWCDFNVHPQKTEVRILKEDILGDQLTMAISDVLACSSQIVEPKGLEGISLPSVRFFDSTVPEEDNMSQELPFSRICDYQNKVPFANICAKEPIQDKQITWISSSEVQFLAAIGKVILAEDSEGVHVVFTEAARKHLFYLSLTKQLNITRNSQMFLSPICLEVTREEAVLLATYLHDFANMGIDLSQIGPCTFSIESAPAFIEENELKSWIFSLVSESKEAFKAKELVSLMQVALTKTLFGKANRNFDRSWLAILWNMGKPKKAFDGTQICRLVLEADFIKE